VHQNTNETSQLTEDDITDNEDDKKSITTKSNVDSVAKSEIHVERLKSNSGG
jgi:hypothetical protein